MDDSAPTLPQRKRMRLANYDYSLGGGYFVTIDVLERRRLFGRIRDGSVKLNPFGQRVLRCWQTLPQRFSGVCLDECILMPDHLHGILVLSSINPMEQPLPSLTDVVRNFKSRSTQLYFRFKELTGRMELETRLWQRSYYERVLRSERDAEEKRAYIRTNPQRYELKRRGEL